MSVLSLATIVHICRACGPFPIIFMSLTGEVNLPSSISEFYEGGTLEQIFTCPLLGVSIYILPIAGCFNLSWLFARLTIRTDTLKSCLLLNCWSNIVLSVCPVMNIAGKVRYVQVLSFLLPHHVNIQRAPVGTGYRHPNCNKIFAIFFPYG